MLGQWRSVKQGQKCNDFFFFFGSQTVEVKWQNTERKSAEQMR